MKRQGLPLVLLAALGACSLGAATWSSDVCGCSPAYQNLAIELGLPDTGEAEELALAAVQHAVRRQVGAPLDLDRLPDTGSGDSCVAVAGGAQCSWRLWSRRGSMKGYEAIYRVSSAGRITSVSVAERVWVSQSGT